jgi:hypothetical protein
MNDKVIALPTRRIYTKCDEYIVSVPLANEHVFYSVMHFKCHLTPGCGLLVATCHIRGRMVGSQGIYAIEADALADGAVSKFCSGFEEIVLRELFK